MAYYEKRKDGWSVRWRDADGTNRRRQVPNVASRDRLIREIEEALAEGRPWEPVAGRNPSISEVADAYLREMKRTWKENTHASQDVSLAVFQAWIEDRSRRKHTGIEVLSKTLIGEYWDYCRTERGLKVSTANLRARSVELMWLWCYDHDEFGPKTPRPRRLKLPSPEQSMTSAPTFEDMDAMIGVLRDERYRRLCFVLRSTGLRFRQALALRWDDIDLARATLRIRPELGKTVQERRGRVIPLAPVLVAELATWGLREGTLLDWSGRRGPHNSTFDRAWARSGVAEERWKGRTAHCFRKGFVSGLIERGANREAVEFLVGHSLGLAGIYTDPRAYALVAAVALVPALTGNVRRLRVAGEGS